MPHGRSGRLALGTLLLGTHEVSEQVRGAPDTWRLGVVGRCEQTLARASRRAAPRAFTVQTISNERMLAEGERAA